MCSKKSILLPALLGIVFSIALIAPSASASTTDGTIDGTNRYAWSENIGWIDFGSSAGNVHVTDAGLSGYAYGENVGWILLSAVTNNGEGTLSGYGWAENVGWIDFSHVTIDSSGVFQGYAYGENIGNTVFNSTNSEVSTDWRPASSRSGGSTPPPAATGYSGGSIAGGSVSAATLATLLAPSASTTAYLNSLKTAQSSALPIPIAPAVQSPVPAFTRDLTLGSHGTDVTALQVYLNSHGFKIASSGVGSPGHETMTFASLTQKALAKFQKAKGIFPAVGYFGTKTRNFINSH